jgi:DNA-binding NarL/FixJ family response regulator
MTATCQAARAALKGCRVIVVEDNALLGLELERLLVELDCSIVGSAQRLEAATRLCADVPFDVALLDINLGGNDTTLALAESLQGRGQAFVLTTGYGTRGVPQSLRAAQLLEKPYRKRDLENALRRALQ